MDFQEKKNNYSLKSRITVPPDQRINRESLIRLLKSFSSSSYDSLHWKLDRMNSDKSPKLIKTLYFNEFASYPIALQELKEWSIIQLSQGRGESSICSSLKSFRKLINLGIFPQEGFLKIEKNILAEYYSQLNLNQPNNSTGLEEWYTLKRFYKDMGSKEISRY